MAKLPATFAGSFWARVDRGAGRSACWPWTGARVVQYGAVVCPDRKTRKTHRVAWVLANERAIPRGRIVRHDPEVCNNPICCNPKHLKLGTIAQNNADKAAIGTSRRAYLTPEQVRDIRASYDGKTRTTERLADRHACSMATVHRVATRRVHSEVA